MTIMASVHLKPGVRSCAAITKTARSIGLWHFFLQTWINWNFQFKVQLSRPLPWPPINPGIRRFAYGSPRRGPKQRKPSVCIRQTSPIGSTRKAWNRMDSDVPQICTFFQSLYFIYLSIDLSMKSIISTWAWDRKKKQHFFWSYGFDYFFVVTAMHFVQANVAIYMFFFNISVRLFFNKMLKKYGFAMPLASEPRPYMAIFAHMWP